MKTFLVSFVLALCTLPVCAQVSIGVIGGYSHAFQQVKNRTGSDYGKEISAVPLWHAGLISDVHLARNFHLQPQILLSAKGVIENINVPSYEYRAETKLLYLEVPLNILYKLRLGPGKLVTGVGAYYAFGLSGDYKSASKTTYPDLTELRAVHFAKIRFGSPPTSGVFANYNYRSTDVGLNLIVGYEFNMGILLQVKYSQGLRDVNLGMPDKRKNAYLGVSAGYLLKLRRR